MMLKTKTLRDNKGMIKGRNGLFELSLRSEGRGLYGGSPELLLPFYEVVSGQSGMSG